MKKRIMIVPMLMMIFSLLFVGCTPVQLEFWQKSQMVKEWEATQTDGTLKMTATIGTEKVDLNMTFSGYVNYPSNDAYVKMSVTEASGLFNLKDIEVYLKEGKFYISRNYIEQLLQLSGEKVPDKLAKSDAKYVLLNVEEAGPGLVGMGAVQSEELAKLTKAIEKLAPQMGVDVPVTKNNNTYSISLDQKQMSGLAKGIFAALPKNIEAINKELGLGLTAKDMEEFKKELVDPSTVDSMNQLCLMFESMVKANFKMDTTYEDNQMIQKMSFNLVEPAMSQSNILVEMGATSKKITQQAITIPGKVLEMSPEDLVTVPTRIVIDTQKNLMMTTKGAQVACKVVKDKNEMYIPAKVVMPELGYTVSYDATSKKLVVKAGEQVAKVKLDVKNGVSYISLSELKKLGFTIQTISGAVVITE